jgi:hypothetical protein
VGTDRRIVVGNEFASVEVAVQRRGNGEQAIVTDLRSGVSRRIDVLALEGLVRAPEWLICSLVDPATGEPGWPS